MRKWLRLQTCRPCSTDGVRKITKIDDFEKENRVSERANVNCEANIIYSFGLVNGSDEGFIIVATKGRPSLHPTRQYKVMILNLGGDRICEHWFTLELD